MVRHTINRQYIDKEKISGYYKIDSKREEQDDPNLYNNTISNNVLNEFVEKNISDYNYYITNIGIIFFYNNNNEIIVYDMFDTVKDDKNEDLSLKSIIPDFSFFDSYTKITTPLSYRKINITNGVFTPEKKLTYNGKTYYWYNCDKIKNKTPNDDYLFSSTESDLETTISVSFVFKPQFRIILHSTTDKLYKDNLATLDISNDGDLNLTLNNVYNPQEGEIVEGVKKQIFDVDLTKFDKEYISINIDPESGNFSGYMEVL